MGTGVPLQALKAAEEAEKLYQDQIDALSGTAPTGEAEPVEEVATGPTGEVEVVVEETSEQKAEKAQHKYDVLQGKYNKEIPELSLRLAEQVGTIRSLQAELSELKGIGINLAPIKKPDETKGVLDSIEQDPNVEYLKAEYPEVWKGIEVAINKVAADTSKKIEKVSSELTEEKKRSEKTARDRFYDDLDKLDGWGTVNRDPEFNEWLDQTEPLTGFKRRDILNDAYASLDSTRAKNFFSEFTEKKVKPVEKEVVIEKKEVKGISPRTTTGKPLVDRSELKENYIKATDVSKFYNDVRKGLYKGRDAEKDKIEAEINKAISERRVIAGQ